MIGNYPYMKDIEILKMMKYLNRDSRMLEIGGGSSTKFLLNFVKSLHTVEHNKEWTDEIKDAVSKMDIEGLDWTVDQIDPAFPQNHPFNPALPKQFDSYVNHVKDLPKDTYDAVLVDGRDRVRCAKAALDSLKVGGYMFIHDFWERPKYHDVLNWPELELVTDTEPMLRERENQLVVLRKIELDYQLSDRNVFVYWEGNEFRLISMLRDLMYKHSDRGRNFRVHLLNKNNIVDYVDVPDNFYKLSLNHQSDYVRVATVTKYGGIYLDSDTIVMDNLDSLFNDLEQYEGFFIKENNQNVSPGVFGSKANTAFMNRWLSDAIAKIEETPNQRWTAFTTDLFSGYEADGLLSSYKLYNGLDTMYPVNWDQCLDEFVKKPYDNHKTLTRDFQPLVILVNSVYRTLEKFAPAEIPGMDIALNYFLEKSKQNVRR